MVSNVMRDHRLINPDHCDAYSTYSHCLLSVVEKLRLMVLIEGVTCFAKSDDVYFVSPGNLVLRVVKYTLYIGKRVYKTLDNQMRL